ncbi:hypothetical protein Taro_010940 [Colocasia esculenta]|uniref:Uncharacterized protein n=1 Tax=Colocasia esculenta TaxID=4460 RepID=A0A843U4Y9_COLES|nr:hypothetical protein [Colocasia esculenta]
MLAQRPNLKARVGVLKHGLIHNHSPTSGMAGLFIFCCSSSTIIPQVALKELIETASMIGSHAGWSIVAACISCRRSSTVGYSLGLVPHLLEKWHVLFANLHCIFLVRRALAPHTKVPPPLDEREQAVTVAAWNGLVAADMAAGRTAAARVGIEPADATAEQ